MGDYCARISYLLLDHMTSFTRFGDAALADVILSDANVLEFTELSELQLQRLQHPERHASGRTSEAPPP